MYRLDWNVTSKIIWTRHVCYASYWRTIDNEYRSSANKENFIDESAAFRDCRVLVMISDESPVGSLSAGGRRIRSGESWAPGSDPLSLRGGFSPPLPAGISSFWLVQWRSYLFFRLGQTLHVQMRWSVAPCSKNKTQTLSMLGMVVARPNRFTAYPVLRLRVQHFQILFSRV